MTATELSPVRPAQGVCEVILYAPRHASTLAQEPVEQIHKLVRVWIDRFEELAALDYVHYVFIFENKGEAIGVTLHHPHGQIYAYPFVPPRILQELQQSRTYWNGNGKCLVCDIAGTERRDGRRLIAENASFTAYIPFFARWPYEVHIVSRRHLQVIAELSSAEQRDLASILKMLLVAYDGLFAASFPYMMVMHQSPTDGGSYPYYHFHIEFYPPLRSANRLKYLAGSESGAGMFINDTLAEEKAAELRTHVAPVTWQMGGNV